MDTEKRQIDLNKCNKADLAKFLGIELHILDAWIERGAPVTQRGSPGQPWVLNFYEVAAWMKAEKPDPDTDPRALDDEARKRWLLSEFERQAIRSKIIVHKAESDQPGKMAVSFLRVELRAIVGSSLVEYDLPPAAGEYLNERIEAAVDAYLERIPGMEWLASNGLLDEAGGG